MPFPTPVTGTFRAAWLVLGLGLGLAGCVADAQDRPAPETSQGQEFGNPEAEPEAATTADLNVPIDTNNPEERTPTVTAPPELPPQAATGGAGGAGGSTQ